MKKEIAFSTRTEDYTLSEMRPSDKAASVRILNIAPLAKNLLRPPFPYTDADAEAHIAENAAKTVTLPDGTLLPEFWIIRDATVDGTADRSMIGAAGVHWVADTQAWTIGYFLDPAFGGHGIMTCVVAELCRLFHGQRLRGEVVEGNTASLGVLQRNGFVLVPDSLHCITWPENKGGDERRIYAYEKVWS